MADEKRTQQVSLGCGTLILIALIVIIFSGRRNGDSSRDTELVQNVQVLRFEVGELKRAVEAQTRDIKALRQILDKQQGAGKDK